MLKEFHHCRNNWHSIFIDSMRYTNDSILRIVSNHINGVIVTVSNENGRFGEVDKLNVVMSFHHNKRIDNHLSLGLHLHFILSHYHNYLCFFCSRNYNEIRLMTYVLFRFSCRLYRYR